MSILTLFELVETSLLDRLAFDDAAVRQLHWADVPLTLARRMARLCEAHGVLCAANVDALLLLRKRVADLNDMSFATCPRLDAATLRRWTELGTVRSIDLGNCAFRDDELPAVESVLVDVAPRLTSLRIAALRLALAESSGAFVQLRELDVSGCRLLSSIAGLALGATALVSLDVSGTAAVDDDLQAVSPLLLRLVAAECPQMSFDVVHQIPFAQLRELCMAGSYLVQDATIGHIVHACPQLERLDISKCNLLTSATCTHLNGATNLQHLTAAWTGISDFDELPSTLLSLDIAWCLLVSAGSLARLVPALRNVRELDLSWSNDVDDAVVRAILSTCRDLRSLILDGCDRLTQHAFDTASLPPRLVKLRIYGLSCSPATVAAFAEQAPMLSDVVFLNNAPAMAVRFAHLTSVNFAHSDAVDDAMVEQVVRHCVHVSDLNLGACKHISDRCAPFIGRLQRLRSLRVGSTQLTDAAFAVLPASLLSLGMQCCERVTDAAVRSIVARMRFLRALNVSQCEALTVAAFNDISGLAMLNTLSVSYNANMFATPTPLTLSPWLRTLSVVSMAGFGDEHLLAILKSCPVLETLAVGDNGALSTDAFSAVWIWAPQLKHLSCRPHKVRDLLCELMPGLKVVAQ